MGAALPVHLDDPGDRLRAVHASTQAAKTVEAALGDNLLSDLVDIAPPALISALVAAYTGLRLDALHPPIFNAIVSNVPGPPLPVYSCGARLLAAYPLGPLLVRSGLNISVLSYIDSMDVGVTTCPDIVDDPWRIAEGMPDAARRTAEGRRARLTSARRPAAAAGRGRGWLLVGGACGHASRNMQLYARTVEIHGHRIAYHAGGDGPVLVLIHGMAGSSATWDAVLPSLAERFAVVAPDLPGHGDSDKPSTADYSLGSYASTVRDLLVALGYERATLVGQSLGGGIAMQYIYQYPEHCERLVLVGSGGLGTRRRATAPRL